MSLRSTLARRKASAKRLLVRGQALAGLGRASWYDATRYWSYSSTRGPFATRDNLAAKVTERYHAIEKGLSLPRPRLGFGRERVLALVALTERYERSFGADGVSEAAWRALADYVDFHLAGGVPEVDVAGAAAVARRRATLRPALRGSGAVPVLSEHVHKAVAEVGLDFFTSRRSTRMFAPTPVGVDDIEFAVEAAASAPAVCNRQFAKAHIWRDREKIDELLLIQGGARGFASDVAALAMITVSLRSYWSAAERNQGWIDGGLFAMNFMLGLHARGLGSVPLNWSKTRATDERMRAATGIDPAEAIIMLIGFGNLLPEYRVAASPRNGQHAQWHD